jgi:hypothetical protein
MTAADAATALNPRAPLSSFRASPPRREVALEMVPVAVPVPGVPRRDPVYDPVPPPRPLKPEEDKVDLAGVHQNTVTAWERDAKDKVKKALQEVGQDVTVKPPPPPPLPTRNIADST